MKVFQCGTHGAPTQCPECVAEEWRKEIASRTVAGRATCNPADATAPTGPGLLKSAERTLVDLGHNAPEDFAASASSTPTPEGRPAPDPRGDGSYEWAYEETLTILAAALDGLTLSAEADDLPAPRLPRKAAAAIDALRTALAAAEAARDGAERKCEQAWQEVERQRVQLLQNAEDWKGLRTALAEAESRASGLEEALRGDEAWPVADVLLKLASAAEHLLHDHDCDSHGWELVEGCAKRATEYAAGIRAALAAHGGKGTR